MLSFLFRQLGSAVVVIFLAITFLVLMIHMVPGDPATVLLGPRATEAAKAALREEMGLDQPIITQVFNFAWRVLHGDLGVDVVSRRPISDIVLDQAPYTLALIGAAMGFAALIGIPLGCFSALYRNSWFDNVIGILSVGAIAIPSFLIAIYCVLIFSIHLNMFPAIGAGRSGDLLEQLSHLVLPAVAIGLNWVGYLARFIRSTMLEVLGERHIRSARAHGLRESRVIFSYALPLVVMPTITIVSVGVGGLISAAVLTEIVFARPGIGKLMFDSISQRNYPIVMATVLFTTILFVASTTLADLLNGLVDPRTRRKD